MVKNIKKLTIFMIAVVAIGTFALPSVLTASTGQHTFIAGTQVQCEKCHNTATASQGVGGEMALSNNTDYGSGDYTGDAGTLDVGEQGMLQGYGGGYARNEKIHADVGCAGCHTVTRGPGAGRGILTTTHVGVKSDPDCAYCHSHVILSGVELNSTSEVHNGPTGGLAAAGKTACIGCHTQVGIRGEVSYGFTSVEQPIGTTGLTIKTSP